MTARTHAPSLANRRVSLAVAIALVAPIGLALACASKPKAQAAPRKVQSAQQDDLAGAPDWIRRGCAAYWADAPERGVCGVGSASGSRNLALTTTTAEGRGRTAIARTLDTKVRSMLKDYQATTTGGEEFGTAAADEQHVVDVSKQLTNGTLTGAERRDLWISPSGVVYALMVLDLQKFQSTVWSMKQLSQDVRSAVAQRAAEEFDGPAEGASAEPGGGDTKVAGPLVLVTQAQLDAMPRDTTVAWGTPKTDPNGPVIQIDSPENGGVYKGPFPIKVEFRDGPSGQPVDMDTLKLEYKVAWGIDITDKVRAYIDGTQIDVAESALPEGRHTVEIQIEDTAGHRSSRIFTVTVE